MQPFDEKKRMIANQNKNCIKIKSKVAILPFLW
jgi:hypothetical protein